MTGVFVRSAHELDSRLWPMREIDCGAHH